MANIPAKLKKLSSPVEVQGEAREEETTQISGPSRAPCASVAWFESRLRRAPNSNRLAWDLSRHKHCASPRLAPRRTPRRAFHNTVIDHLITWNVVERGRVGVCLYVISKFMLKCCPKWDRAVGPVVDLTVPWNSEKVKDQISTILRANEPADGGLRKPWLTAILKHLPVCRYHMRLDTPATT
ncbi:hypothetical protein TEA_020322 [Camellia sinensis var. sinensis]|uniref:Uncharacterized protein n=1 Tax=Camellia sinensis var. sinensis TaxID=542762 RepID=A0A4S4CZ37_CAMSN|nr:hypothetical protein TEA_020322 [Camellia sinensis var. sinensis]